MTVVLMFQYSCITHDLLVLSHSRLKESHQVIRDSWVVEAGFCRISERIFLAPLRHCAALCTNRESQESRIRSAKRERRKGKAASRHPHSHTTNREFTCQSRITNHESSLSRLVCSDLLLPHPIPFLISCLGFSPSASAAIRLLQRYCALLRTTNQHGRTRTPAPQWSELI